jgi:hypothetical protein
MQLGELATCDTQSHFGPHAENATCRNWRHMPEPTKQHIFESNEPLRQPLSDAAHTYLDAKPAYDMATAGYTDTECPDTDALSDCHQALRSAINQQRTAPTTEKEKP